MKKVFYTLCLLLFCSCTIMGQKAAKNKYYWQQEVAYTMDIDMDVKTYQYKGKQKLVYKTILQMF